MYRYWLGGRGKKSVWVEMGHRRGRSLKLNYFQTLRVTADNHYPPGTNVSYPCYSVFCLPAQDKIFVLIKVPGYHGNNLRRYLSLSPLSPYMLPGYCSLLKKSEDKCSEKCNKAKRSLSEWLVSAFYFTQTRFDLFEGAGIILDP